MGHEGVPGRRHADGNRERDRGEHKRRCPHGGAVNAAESDELKGEKQEKKQADTGHGARGGRETYAVPGTTPEGSSDQAHAGDEDEALVRVGPAAGWPG